MYQMQEKKKRIANKKRKQRKGGGINKLSEVSKCIRF